MFDLILRKQSKECCSHRGQCQYRNGMPVQPPMCPEKVICTINHRSSKECCSIRAYTTSFNMKSLEGSLGGQIKKIQKTGSSRILFILSLNCIYSLEACITESFKCLLYLENRTRVSKLYMPGCTCPQSEQVTAGPSKGRHSWPSLTRATSCSARQRPTQSF